MNRKRKNSNLALDFFNLINLAGSNSGEGDIKVSYSEFFRLTKLFFRFSESLLLTQKAKQLGL